ncbi:MAG: hypothetical protein COW47_00715, partial [Candidatus Huberarchaeum crystalense]
MFLDNLIQYNMNKKDKNKENERIQMKMKNIIIKICLLSAILLVLNPIVAAEICECNSCEDCTKKLNDASCTEVYLSKNI